MAKRKSTTRNKPISDFTVDSVPLSFNGGIEAELLDLTDKSDAVDASRHMVREGRFKNSFMMGTNGGSTYERMLRPSAPHPESALTGPVGQESASGGLHNLGSPNALQLIADTSRIPARSVALLSITPEKGPMRYGTAWLIGPRTLATAAHNLLHPEVGATQAMLVHLAFDGHVARGGTYRVIDNHFLSGWRQRSSDISPLDFAVIKIEDPEIGNRRGWFGFADYEDAKFNNMIVNVFGHPATRPRAAMYGSAGRVVQSDPGFLWYDCQTEGGMSGGPVIAVFGEERIAVGIHIAGGGGSNNRGARLNNAAYDMFMQYQSW
ncbi:hypothetical protein GCM10011317_01930 [Niveispirillum cyanobacteriorum]|nr:trypsin-like peptidase domain-containing protein [Niveispirillum cyanobacteriorum]GGE47184.1 hypothetical protein GCM10011317_01930 [Niveispirillum cyanobacteriorum]